MRTTSVTLEVDLERENGRHLGRWGKAGCAKSWLRPIATRVWLQVRRALLRDI
jgi:hypothetical protein